MNERLACYAPIGNAVNDCHSEYPRISQMNQEGLPYMNFWFDTLCSLGVSTEICVICGLLGESFTALPYRGKELLLSLCITTRAEPGNQGT